MERSDLPTLIVDIDGVLTKETKGYTPRDYANRTPRESSIAALDRLKEKYYIVLHSGRYGTPVNYAITVAWLTKWDFFYDELVLGKPLAVAYIDDKAMRFGKDHGGMNWEAICQALSC